MCIYPPPPPKKKKKRKKKKKNEKKEKDFYIFPLSNICIGVRFFSFDCINNLAMFSLTSKTSIVRVYKIRINMLTIMQLLFSMKYFYLRQTLQNIVNKCKCR